MGFISDFIGGITGASDQADAAQAAAQTQSAAAQKGIDEQGRQFDAVKALMQPYVQAGYGGLSGQQDLLGLNGSDKQSAAISAIQNSPQFSALQQQGTNNILQNASATGGLRGGNTQGALAQFGPQLLSSLIDQQYSRLGGITSIGQNAAAGQGNAGLQTGNNIANLLQQQGAATAGGQIAQGNVQSQIFGTILNGLGAYAGAGGGFGGFGGLGGQSGVISGGSGFQAPGGSFGGGYGSGYGLTGMGGKF